METSNLTGVPFEASPNPVLLPPSSALPALSKLSSFSSHHISRILDDLKAFYWPPKIYTQPTTVVPSNLALPTRKLKHLQHIHDYSVPDSGYASAEDDEDDDILVDNYVASVAEDTTEVLRADPFERAFAIKWVTGLIARADVWAEEAAEGDDEDEGTVDMGNEQILGQSEWQRRIEVVERASTILSMFIGDDGSGEEDPAVTRTFSFPFRGSVDQKVNAELNDDPLDKEDHTSVGLQSWASAIVMSEQMCVDPGAFSLDFSPDSGISGQEVKRILELGAGTGLLSIVAAKINAQYMHHVQIQDQEKPMIVATDFHPDVLANCTRNTETNFPSMSSPVIVHKLDWERPDYSHPVDEPFDLILAADVIYHPDHARWIRGVVEKLLKRPSQHLEENGGIFWMMMAVRQTGRHEGLDKTVDEVFPPVPGTTVMSGMHLAITRRAEFAKQGGLGRADEGGYKLFGIEWVKV
ncbi:hypothetical protein VKT23_006440 [Stygiomarasmius scandens]|uniref:S-adenosylmethionine-dependent methyltransferase n=1 Tax=Marasmiellus scandens TaxID=2682957 RepID=A0ABR1JMV2_9AGAR